MRRALSSDERRAVLHLDGWAGRTRQPCLVVSETPKRYRVRALPGSELRVPKGRQGLVIIYPPGTHLVPKYAITFGHIWFGVTVENRAFKSRISLLRRLPARVRFLSVEPLLEDIGELDLEGIHWVIVGGESGPGARPFNVQWARSIVRQCRAAGVRVFVKQLGANPVSGCARNPDDILVTLSDSKGGDWAEWPEDLRVREFPV